ncbi:MAG: MBL fold metallo-hydrolase [Spirochaetes bacterium]|nr:MBL fold metallo-hydrolase [Spirochaetota bacterium]
MKINKFINGPFSVNTYLIESGGNALIIDPGHDISKMIEYILIHKLNVSHILITHGHIDHIAGVNTVRKYFPDAVSMMNPADDNLVRIADNQSRLFGLPVSGPIIINEYLPDAGSIKTGFFEAEIFLVPGHSPGSLCFKFENYLFTGDTLFYGSVGRSDLFDGDHNLLIKSIREKLFMLDKDTSIYPGHGNASTIGFEIMHNPFFN